MCCAWLQMPSIAEPEPCSNYKLLTPSHQRECYAKFVLANQKLKKEDVVSFYVSKKKKKKLTNDQ